jgi:hypothetical protein
MQMPRATLDGNVRSHRLFSLVAGLTQKGQRLQSCVRVALHLGRTQAYIALAA